MIIKTFFYFIINLIVYYIYIIKIKPIYDENNRKFLVNTCKYVDEVLENAL